jgi:hypothetical protein
VTDEKGTAVDLDRDQQTGTGTPRSADDDVRPPAEDDRTEPDDPVITGATTGSHPALSDEVTPNRSGSGGSGGGLGGDDGGATEGSGSRSMDEMLGEGGKEADRARER